MIASRASSPVCSFFSDMLGFSDFETVSKDPTFFPRYTLNVKNDSQEQTLRTIVDQLVNRHGDYRDVLYHSRHTFLTRELAVTVRGCRWWTRAITASRSAGSRTRIRLGDPRAGILSEASFTAAVLARRPHLPDWTG